MVAPITHVEPNDASSGGEISAADAAALGLDSRTSWIIVDEYNYFTWIGPDVEQDLSTGDYEVGFLAPVLFRQVTERFIELRRLRRAKFVPRDDKPADGDA
jgi:hypothetical protein